MESDNFGDYITKQYGLLKQILSYLQPCDLRNAKLVCSDWKSAVESMLDNDPTWLICGNENTLPVHTTLPALIIQHPFSHVYPKKCNVCKKSCFLCPCTLSDTETLFISLDARCVISSAPAISQQRYEYIGSSYSFWQSVYALMIPSSPKIQVSTFMVRTTSKIFKEPITDDVVQRCLGGDQPLKCLFVISKTGWGSKKARWINQLLSYVVNKQGPTFAVGGGDIRSVFCKKGFSKDRWEKPGLILVALRGENVSAHSDILSSFNKKKVESFMIDLGRRVGPLPEGHSRVAFIAQCVDRADPSVEDNESGAFKTAFPFVPQFGYRAYGEYGIRSYSSDEPEQRYSSKKMKLTFDHAHTTSLVILTFKKV